MGITQRLQYLSQTQQIAVAFTLLDIVVGIGVMVYASVLATGPVETRFMQSLVGLMCLCSGMAIQFWILASVTQ